MTTAERLPLPTAVLASGRGSNFEALADHAFDRERRSSPSVLWRPTLVLSDRPEARVLERARARGCDTAIVDPSNADEILGRLEGAAIRMVLLAGYLKLVPAQVVRAYRSRILNIHPGRLPDYGGRGMYGHRVHEAVLAAGDAQTEVTIHLVDEVYDRGTVLARERVPVHPGDDPDRLAARVLEVEHRLYPRVADHLARCIIEDRPCRPLTESTFISTEPEPT